MKKFKSFNQQSGIYTLKMTQTSTYILGIFGLLLLYVAFFVIDATNTTAKYSSAAIGALLLLAAYLRMGARFIIDKNQKKIMFKRNALAKEQEFSMDDFSRFYVEKLVYLGIITTNISGNIYFLKEGKEKGFMMIQSFLFASPVQRAIDEAAEILEIPND